MSLTGYRKTEEGVEGGGGGETTEFVLKKDNHCLGEKTSRF